MSCGAAIDAEASVYSFGHGSGRSRDLRDGVHGVLGRAGAGLRNAERRSGAHGDGPCPERRLDRGDRRTCGTRSDGERPSSAISADLEGGVSITVTDVEVLEVEANTPGEIAGPAVALTIDVENSSDEAIDLSTAMVSVTGSGGSYGQATTSEPFSPFSARSSRAPRRPAVYVFRLPAEERDSLSSQRRVRGGSADRALRRLGSVVGRRRQQ